MRARFAIATVILIAGFACTGGPISDLPFGDNSGGEEPGIGPSPSGDGASLDAAAEPTPPGGSLGEQEPNQGSPDAGAASPGEVVPGACGDGSIDGSVDAAHDAGNSDAGIGTAPDAAGDASAFEVEASSNFSVASDATDAGAQDAMSDAPHSSPEASTCSP